MRRVLAGCLLCFLLLACTRAQEPEDAAGGELPPSASSPRPGRGARTREFLGLGAAPDAAAAARGEKVYGPNCGFCHGAKANGAEAPDLVRSALVLHDENGELIGPVVSKGRSEKGMPAFPSLTEVQLRDVAQFLHMRVELAANRGLYKVLNVVTGSAKAGESYFNSTGRCNTCHSAVGDLAHVGSKYAPADLQAQFLYPGSSARFDPGAPRKTAPVPVTVILNSGESVTGVLKRFDDFDVSVYDAAGKYHSWARETGLKVNMPDRLLAHRELLDQYSDQDMHNLLAYLVTLK